MGQSLVGLSERRGVWVVRERFLEPSHLVVVHSCKRTTRPMSTGGVPRGVASTQVLQQHRISEGRGEIVWQSTILSLNGFEMEV